jgi:hypothetical protein
MRSWRWYFQIPFLPGVIERHLGDTLSVSSIAGLEPDPYTTTWAAPKRAVKQQRSSHFVGSDDEYSHDRQYLK